jgi:hypothetical protein
MVSLIKGIDNKLLINEIEVATENTYPIKEGKRYINAKYVFMYIKENKSAFPNVTTVSDKQIKRVITLIYNTFGWKVQANLHAKHGRSPIFIRPDGELN